MQPLQPQQFDEFDESTSVISALLTGQSYVMIGQTKKILSIEVVTYFSANRFQQYYLTINI